MLEPTAVCGEEEHLAQGKHTAREVYRGPEDAEALSALQLIIDVHLQETRTGRVGGAAVMFRFSLHFA